MNRIRHWALKLYGLVKLLRISASHADVAHTIRRVVSEHLSYLDTLSLSELHDSVARLERDSRAGILIEAGCALGGSALVIAASKAASRELYVYDVFGMIPPPSERDGEDVHQRYGVIASGGSDGIGGDTYYGYKGDLLEAVQMAFAEFGYPILDNNIHLVQGLFEDTLVVTEPVALAHIDSDWYDSVFVCLQRIVPKLVRNGMLIIDDYDAWSGCRAAVDDYFAGKEDQFEFVTKARLHIIRK